MQNLMIALIGGGGLWVVTMSAAEKIVSAVSTVLAVL